MTSRLAWFVTESGRRTVGICATIGGCGLFSVNYLPQTLFLKKYHDLVTMRK